MKYHELWVASKNEKERLAELWKRRQYSRSTQQAEKVKPCGKTQKHTRTSTPGTKSAVTTPTDKPQEPRKRHYCKKIGHEIRDREKQKSDDAHRNQKVLAKHVASEVTSWPQETPDPYDLLFPNSEREESVKQIVVADKGSKAQYAPVNIWRVPANGDVDTGANTTIMGGELFGCRCSEEFS